MEIVIISARSGETKIALDDGSGLRKDFLDKTFVKKALGPPAQVVLEQHNESVRQTRRNYKEAEREKKNGLKMSLQN